MRRKFAALTRFGTSPLSDCNPHERRTRQLTMQSLARTAALIAVVSFVLGGAGCDCDGGGGGGVTGVTNHRLVLTVTGGGHVETTPTSADGSYPDGSTVVLNAFPDLGFKFGGWTGGITSPNRHVEVLMTSDLTLSANFPRPVFDLQPTFVTSGPDHARACLGTGISYGGGNVVIVNAGSDSLPPPVKVVMSAVNQATGAETDFYVWDDFSRGAVWLPGATFRDGPHVNGTPCPAGTYKFRVVVDPANKIVEADENNNALLGASFVLTP